MLRQKQSDALINYLDTKIASLTDEIETSEAGYAEAPNRSEFLEMKHSDGVGDLRAKLNLCEALKRDAEDIETLDDQPAFSIVGGVGLALVGVLIACCFLFENSELSWLS